MNMMLVLQESRAICPYSVGLHGGIHDDEEMGELFRVNVPSVNPKICESSIAYLPDIKMLFL
jgi:hypothetical protein